MLWLHASSILLLGAAIATFWLLTRRLNDLLARQCAALTQLAGLQTDLAALKDDLQQLRSALDQANSPLPPMARDTLASIESLADPATLANGRSLSDLAAQLPQIAPPHFADIFDRDKKSLTVARLQDQGLSPAEISRRLSLPIGEVEFILSLRPASSA